MEAWPPLAVELVCEHVREYTLDEVASPLLLCVVQRTEAMCDLE
jgi:hypothetical protein